MGFIIDTARIVHGLLPSFMQITDIETKKTIVDIIHMVEGNAEIFVQKNKKS
jgi:hypothetical protein